MERHMGQLRERMNEFEQWMDKDNSFQEASRLMARQKELEEKFLNEKKQIVDSYEAKLRKLRLSTHFVFCSCK